MGLFWLTACITSLFYAVMFYVNYKYAWLFGFIMVFISQLLIILFWKDAKLSTVINIVILLVSIMALAQYNFKKLVQQETAYILNQSEISNELIINENDIKNLPVPIKRWLRQSGVMGKPFINLGELKQDVKIRMRPGEENWINATALQYTRVDNPAFIWTIDANVNDLLNFQGRDKFEYGKGQMLIKVNSLINLVNGEGEKLSEACMQRYLGEMVWFPSMALCPYISWKQINDTSAVATMNYQGTRGSVSFYFNSDGDFSKLIAQRYKDNEADARRYEWSVLV